MPRNATNKIYTECLGEFRPLGKGKVIDVSEGSNGEDRFVFNCEHCNQTHTNATATR